MNYFKTHVLIILVLKTIILVTTGLYYQSRDKKKLVTHTYNLTKIHLYSSLNDFRYLFVCKLFCQSVFVFSFKISNSLQYKLIFSFQLNI